MAIKIAGEIVITDTEDLDIYGNATIGGNTNISGDLTASGFKFAVDAGNITTTGLQHNIAGSITMNSAPNSTDEGAQITLKHGGSWNENWGLDSYKDSFRIFTIAGGGEKLEIDGALGETRLNNHLKLTGSNAHYYENGARVKPRGIGFSRHTETAGWSGPYDVTDLTYGTCSCMGRDTSNHDVIGVGSLMRADGWGTGMQPESSNWYQWATGFANQEGTAPVYVGGNTMLNITLAGGNYHCGTARSASGNGFYIYSSGGDDRTDVQCMFW